MDADVRAGDPGLPELGGLETQFAIRFGTTDTTVRSCRRAARRRMCTLTHYMRSPESPLSERTNEDVTQLEFGTATFWKWGPATVCSWPPPAAHRSTINRSRSSCSGYAFRLDAFRVGERRGDHYAVVTAGVLRQLGQMPDFMGGPIFIGTWLQNGSAFTIGRGCRLQHARGRRVWWSTP